MWKSTSTTNDLEFHIGYNHTMAKLTNSDNVNNSLGKKEILEESAIVRKYLEFTMNNKPKRGRKRSPDTIQRKIAFIQEKLQNAGPLNRLAMIQEKIDLEKELRQIQEDHGHQDLEASFIKVAKSFGLRKGISFKAWKEAGVRPEVLKRAGIEDN